MKKRNDLDDYSFPKKGQKLKHFKVCSKEQKRTEHETEIIDVSKDYKSVEIKTTCKTCDFSKKKTITYKKGGG